MSARQGRIGASVLVAIMLATPVGAVMEIENNGPLLLAGRFALRVSNVGVLGNPWFDVGRSFDPSFEFPRGSGNELLGRAELWVGALTADGTRRVSGGPMLEWRPTLDPLDRVVEAMAGDPGSRWNFDDDGDGRIDEDPLDGRDNDGDGRIDEDYDLPAQQMLVATFTDDQPEAVNYSYASGESHVPLGLSVRQEAFSWTSRGFDGVAGLRFVVTNVGREVLRDIRLGLYVDLDARSNSDRGGHLDDRIERLRYEQIVPKDTVTIIAGGSYRKLCFDRIAGEVVVVRDSRGTSGLPIGAVVPLTHTTDPLSLLSNEAYSGVREARSSARAPAGDSTFRIFVFAQDLPPGQGGPPIVDQQRWAALTGTLPEASEGQVHDYAALVSCGPFSHLAPGLSVEFSVALIASFVADSVASVACTARRLSSGRTFNLQPDTTGGWAHGSTGINGHEVCYEPPPGIVFSYDPHCPEKFFRDPLLVPDPGTLGPSRSFDVRYSAGHCVWTDFDCDACTGRDGVDIAHRWSQPVLLPSPPSIRVIPGDGEATIEWDDAPEAALRAGLVGDPYQTFAGYKLYRLDDWRRASQLPPPEQWHRIAVYRADTALGGLPLDSIRDETVMPDGTIDGVPKHPIGRYRVVDNGLHVGADYHYVVTSFVRSHAPHDTLPSILAEQESPFVPDYAQRVTPHTTARAGPPKVWVAPNPYRGHADWERPPVPGDPFTHHLDFMGLPREHCTIRIYTLAGDLVASIAHDGSQGDGQASWNLISRNGQDIVSGVYLFTVDGASGHQVGRFIVIR